MAAIAEKYSPIENLRGRQEPGRDHASAFPLILPNGSGRQARRDRKAGPHFPRIKENSVKA
jgi:hypothetical protein